MSNVQLATTLKRFVFWFFCLMSQSYAVGRRRNKSKTIKSSLNHLSVRLLSVALPSSVLCPMYVPAFVANTAELRQTKFSFLTGSDPCLMDVFAVQKMTPGAVRACHDISWCTHTQITRITISICKVVYTLLFPKLWILEADDMRILSFQIFSLCPS